MPIKFISLNHDFNTKIRNHGFDAENIYIQDYVPTKKTYYVSPANSLCSMGAGIDYPLSRIIFPNAETTAKTILLRLHVTNKEGTCYLPIGSSIILDQGNKSLVISPTMLLPQNIAKTKNAYYATMAVLYNILVNREERLEDIDILFTALCCEYGEMEVNDSIHQILQGINDYKEYKPVVVNSSIILNEPNLYEQPKLPENAGWFE